MKKIKYKIFKNNTLDHVSYSMLVDNQGNLLYNIKEKIAKDIKFYKNACIVEKKQTGFIEVYVNNKLHKTVKL